MEVNTLAQALPRLLEKTLERGWRAVVIANSVDRVEMLNGVLWTYNRESFLPHGSKNDGNSERQPVWLTREDENPNCANVLFLVDGANSVNIAEYDLCCELFDGQDSLAVACARKHWRLRKEAGFDVTYWRQTKVGSWENIKNNVIQKS